MLLYQIPKQAQRERAAFSVVGLDPTDGSPGAELCVEPGLRFHLPAGAKLMSTCISGGALDGYLREQKQLWGAAFWLLIEPMCHVFPLPCPDGEGTPVSEAEGRAIQASRPCYDAPEFDCKYCVFESDGKYYVHLFDTEDSMKKKLEMAISLQIDNIIYIM